MQEKDHWFSLLECIKKYIIDRFNTKRQERLNHPLGHVTIAIYLENRGTNNSCNAIFNKGYYFEVIYNTVDTIYVNLQERTCTCKAW